MSSVPSGRAQCSIACKRSATHTPPVWMPTMTVSGVSVGAMASASRAISGSTSGNEACIKKSLQYQLGGHGVGQRLVLLAVDAAFVQFGFGGGAGVALVDQKHRKAEARFQLAREVSGDPRHLVLAAVGVGGQA